jgi:hypothetical protein
MDEQKTPQREGSLSLSLSLVNAYIWGKMNGQKIPCHVG